MAGRRRWFLFAGATLALLSAAWVARDPAAAFELVQIGGDANPCSCSKRIE